MGVCARVRRRLDQSEGRQWSDEHRSEGENNINMRSDMRSEYFEFLFAGLNKHLCMWFFLSVTVYLFLFLFSLYLFFLSIISILHPLLSLSSLFPPLHLSLPHLSPPLFSSLLPFPHARRLPPVIHFLPAVCEHRDRKREGQKEGEREMEGETPSIFVLQFLDVNVSTRF